MCELILDIMEKCRHGHILVLPQRHSSFAGTLTGKGGETPSPKSVAGMLETDPCAKRTDLYHLPVQLQIGSVGYEPIRRVGRFYTVTREQLESL